MFLKEIGKDLPQRKLHVASEVLKATLSCPKSRMQEAFPSRMLGEAVGV